VTAVAGASGTNCEVVEVSRSLRCWRAPDPFTHRTLAELGERAFGAQVDLALVGLRNRYALGLDGRGLIAATRAAVGPAFDPATWSVAFAGDDAIGVVMAQRLPDEAGVGVLVFLGVRPERRGRGLGRKLHAAGLGILARAGATRYRDRTDVENEPMLRIFAANGCRVVARERLPVPGG
jgi:ribosomal protein S18 acetylase RimI-like enzyme